MCRWPIREMSAAGLELVDAESLRRHYALTCEHWSRRFEQALPSLRAIAGERQVRIWRIYLAGCAMGFARRWMNIYQLLAVKSGAETAGLPLTRDYMYDHPSSGPLTATAGAACGAARRFHAGPTSRMPRTRFTADTM